MGLITDLSQFYHPMRIKIDYFSKSTKRKIHDGDVRNNETIYFLSHAHTDHMKGLESFQGPGVIYCSKDTAALVRNMGDMNSHSCNATGKFVKRYAHLPLTVLPNEHPQVLSCNGATITVTLLPANHCPGSVMFLFEGKQGNILYTGDMRVDEQYLKGLKQSIGNTTIHKLYLDTTFYKDRSSSLPSIQDSNSVILEEIARIPSNKVILLKCSMFGYENLYREINNRYGQQIHVNKETYYAYTDIPHILACLTLDPSKTRFHACRGCSRIPKDSRHYNEQHVVAFLPSVQWFTRRDKNITAYFNETTFIPEHSTHRVLYSLHSSKNEIDAFVSVIRPMEILSIVDHPEKDNEQEMIVLFRRSSGKTDTLSHSMESGNVMKTLSMLYEPSKRAKSIIYNAFGCTKINPMQPFAQFNPQIIGPEHASRSVLKPTMSKARANSIDAKECIPVLTKNRPVPTSISSPPLRDISNVKVPPSPDHRNLVMPFTVDEDSVEMHRLRFSRGELPCLKCIKFKPFIR